MAALQGIQRILCPELLIKRTCLRIRDLCVRGLYIPMRAYCLPAISLTRTPGGRHMEWAAAFFDPCFERLEKGVYYVGLVSVSPTSINTVVKGLILHIAGVFLPGSNWHHYSSWDLLYLPSPLSLDSSTSSSVHTVYPLWPLPSSQCLFPLFQGSLH